MIYFIEAKAVGLIKIGHTGKNPNQRFSHLKVASPVKLSRLALMLGDRGIECKIHVGFEVLRVHGEWFRDDPKIREFIAAHASDWNEYQPASYHIKFEYENSEQKCIDAINGLFRKDSGLSPRTQNRL